MGQTVSVLGDAVFNVAIAWEVLLLTGSATAMSLILIAQWAPRIVFLLLGGVIADRVSRRLLMLWADAGRGCIVMVVAWLSWAHLLQFWHLVALAPLFGIVSSFFDPAYQAIMPQLVETETLSSVNSLTTLSRNVGFLLGPALGAICATLFGQASAFAFDGLTFAISALFLLALRLPPSPAPSQAIASVHPAEAGGPREGVWGAMKDAREGLRYVFSTTWLWVTVLASPLVSVGFAGSMWVSLPRLVHDVYGAGVWLIGAMATADAVGSIIAALTIGNARKLRRGIVAYTAVLAGGLALIACAIPLPRPVRACNRNCCIDARRRWRGNFHDPLGDDTTREGAERQTGPREQHNPAGSSLYPTRGACPGRLAGRPHWAGSSFRSCRYTRGGTGGHRPLHSRYS